MARGRGGSRTGSAGNNYTNRTDLRTTQPVQATGNGVYGSVGEQEAQLAAMPLENSAGVQNQMAQQAQQVYPGELGAFDRPTDRPTEPLTAGAAIGAGPGADALNQFGPGNEIDQANAEDAAAMAEQLPTFELMANMPGSSAAFRNFVRRLRASVPQQ